MKKICTFLALTYGLFISAQPVFQYSNTAAAGVGGTVFIAAKPTSPGPSGAGVTFNFS